MLAHTWSVATSHSIAARRKALSEYGTTRSAIFFSTRSRSRVRVATSAAALRFLTSPGSFESYLLLFAQLRYRPWKISIREAEYLSNNSLNGAPPNGGVKSRLHQQNTFCLCKIQFQRKGSEWETYGQSLQVENFFDAPLMTFTTAGWKNSLMSRRLSSRDWPMSSIGWTSTSIRSPSLSTSTGFPSDPWVFFAVTTFSKGQIFSDNYIHWGRFDSPSASFPSSTSSSVTILAVDLPLDTLAVLAATRRLLAVKQISVHHLRHKCKILTAFGLIITILVFDIVVCIFVRNSRYIAFGLSYWGCCVSGRWGRDRFAGGEWCGFNFFGRAWVKSFDRYSLGCKLRLLHVVGICQLRGERHLAWWSCLGSRSCFRCTRNTSDRN